MRKAVVVVLAVCVLAFGVPLTLNYQGKITDASGVGLNGHYSMEFRIYDAPTGGTLLWSEEHSSVDVEKGLFSVLLGEINPIDLPFDEQYYLEVRVEGDALGPRMPLSSVPYAFRARVADSVAGGTGGSSQWSATATYIYPDSAGEAVKIYNNGRVYADVSAGVSAGQAAMRGDVSGTVWGALGYYDGTNYRAGEFSGDVEIVNSGNLYVSGQIFDGDASDPDVNIGEDLSVDGDVTVEGSATFCAGGFGYVNVNNARIVNVADPTAAQDAATKNYVDSHFLQSVNTASPIIGNGTSSSPVTIESGGITSDYLADNAVITSKIADEAVTAAKISPSGGSEGQVLKIVSGVVQWADDEGGTSGVNSVTAGAGLSNSGTSSDPVLDVNAGDGLGIVSDQLVVNVDGTTIEIASDQLGVAAGGIGTTQLADGAVTGAKIASMGASTGDVLKWDGTEWAPAADSVNDADADATNELQTLSLSGNQLTISDGNTVTFSGWDTDASNDLTTSTTFGGDVSGTYNSLDIGSGVVGNTEIADATQFVDIYTNGTYRFSVTDGSQTLDINEGTGIDISYSATGHDITITHQDMSSQSSVNNSGGTVIQDVTLDYTGHVTGLASVNLDNRYAQGSGTANYLVKWTGTRSVGNSQIYDTGTNVGIGTTSPAAKLHIITTKTDEYDPSNPGYLVSTLRVDNMNPTSTQYDNQYAAIGFRVQNYSGGNNAWGYITLVQPDPNWGYGYFAFVLRQAGSGSPAQVMKIENDGDVYIKGKLNADGGIDPPYVGFTMETRRSIYERVRREISKDKLNQAIMFWNSNTRRIEIYIPTEGSFYDLNGNLLIKDSSYIVK